MRTMPLLIFFFFNDTATTEIYTLSLHDALPIFLMSPSDVRQANFTGMLVNAVTKGGTNDWHGGGVYNFLQHDFSGTDFLTTTPNVKQKGVHPGRPVTCAPLSVFPPPPRQARHPPR